MSKSNETRQLTDSEQQTFHELYQKYRERVYSICFGMTQNASESEDLTQEVFIRLFRTIGSFRGESAFTTWLYRLTVNLHLQPLFGRHLLVARVARAVEPSSQIPIEARIVTLVENPEIVLVHSPFNL